MLLRSAIRRVLRRSTRFPGIALKLSRSLVVRMDTTNRCNLRCSMCPMKFSDADPERVWMDMDPDLFSRIAGQVFPGAKSVALSCGAEPLCNPDFPRYLEMLYKADVPVREMVTNGLLLTGDKLESLLSFPPSTVFVSVDGAVVETQAAIRGGCDLNVVIGNLRTLSEKKAARRARLPRLVFSTTLQRRNLAELPGIIRLAAECGAHAVNFSFLVPYEGLDMASETLDPKCEAVDAVLEEADRIAKSLGVLLAGSGTAAVVAECRYIENWVFIAPDGLVFPCPYWNLREPIGDLRSESFRDARNGMGYRLLRDRLASGVLEGVCSSCPELTGSSRGEIRKV